MIYTNISGTNDEYIVEVQVHDATEIYIDLAYIIIPALKALRAQSNGAPRACQPADHFWDENGDQQLTFDFIDFDSEAVEAQAIFFKRLDKVIWAFEQIMTPEYITKRPPPGQGPWSVYQQDVQDGLDLFSKHFQDLWN